VCRSTAALTACLALAILAAWCVGMFDRGYWTPDEPREADISWRMSWQSAKAVPLLAGEAFCEKPPFAYWVAGASMRRFGVAAWAARLPNLVYALITAVAVLLLARRSAGNVAGIAAAAAISTFLLAYQVAIWLATDAPLLAAVSVALLGEYIGFYASGRRERLGGYLLMHCALAVGFLCKSAAAWMVPALAFVTLVAWERRWREFLRWELYAGLLVQLLVILSWVWFVYTGSDGVDHLRVFFWNNLVGRFTRINAPSGLQYTAGHRNSPGKYFVELPLYLWPWTLLVAAAVRSAWRRRGAASLDLRAGRFALACLLPTLAVLSLAATARNIYLAPALPGAALLLGWWVGVGVDARDRWDLRALRGTAAMLLIASAVAAAAAALIGWDAWNTLGARAIYVIVCASATLAAASLALYAWFAVARGRINGALCALLSAYAILLSAAASQAYPRIDRWQDLASVGRALKSDIGADRLVLIAPDETTRAWVDMYTSTEVERLATPANGADLARLRRFAARAPHSRFLLQLGGRRWSPRILALAHRLGIHPASAGRSAEPAWLADARLRVLKIYELPYGRRYALLAPRGEWRVAPL